jgi:hypothetical protein
VRDLVRFRLVAQNFRNNDITATVSCPMTTAEEQAWIDQCRDQLQRHVTARIKYGFCHVHKPVLDDVPFRSFPTMAEYRAWCERELPEYLGYRRPGASQRDA